MTKYKKTLTCKGKTDLSNSIIFDKLKTGFTDI